MAHPAEFRADLFRGELVGLYAESAAIEAGGDPVAGLEHVVGDLGLYGVHVVHEGGRADHAAGEDEEGDEGYDEVIAHGTFL